MRANNVEVQMLIGDKPVHEITLSDRTFWLVERDRDFVLRVHAPAGQRILVVASVDGLSVMDGKPATDNASGYVVNPGSKVDIPGYRVDDSTVAAFRIDSVTAAYATRMGYGSDSVGVIGVRVYTEMYQYPAPVYATSQSKSGHLRGLARLKEPLRSASVGTSFGAALDHKVTSVDFKRGRLLAEFVAEYNDYEGLLAAGLPRILLEPVPKAFAAPRSTGCTPPSGWPK